MRRIAILALLVALLVPATAMASGSSTCQAYNPQLCATVGPAATHTTASPSGSAKTLPFTGLDAFLLVGGGITLLGTGVVVRLLARRIS